MSRWEPDAKGRLAEAAFQLYGERGYEGTTVTDIAQRAGVTERTFFRYFVDKREVLFTGSEDLIAAAVSAIEQAPAAQPPMESAAAAAQAAARVLQLRRDHARRRQQLLDANPSLQERELLKMAALRTSLTAALEARGVLAPIAALAGMTAASVFALAFERWIAEGESREFAELVVVSFAELKELLEEAA